MDPASNPILTHSYSGCLLSIDRDCTSVWVLLIFQNLPMKKRGETFFGECNVDQPLIKVDEP